ncbi:INO80 complex subunit E isoform X3 [Hypanus sabinus]|uniref:INO80 complex subunit E isoform X3 n=1 Tax=Hypanus sabinus TaxID=79690 RepID=UPI0028C3B3C2|nr:INO80 complex subunit E isoform X3 [Hypanus sabinus]
MWHPKLSAERGIGLLLVGTIGEVAASRSLAVLTKRHEHMRRHSSSVQISFGPSGSPIVAVCCTQRWNNDMQMIRMPQPHLRTASLTVPSSSILHYKRRSIPPLPRKRSPPLGGSASTSPTSLSLQPSLGYPPSRSTTPTQSPYLGTLPASLRSSPPGSVSLPFSGPPDPLPALSSKLPPATILSTVPHQMFSTTGEGSEDEPIDGDDDLVIDIPE